MQTTPLTAHLSTAELGQRYRAARCPIERSHLQIVWLLSQGRSEREVAAVTGYGQRWIAAIVQRYNAEGTGGLGDRRAKNAGAQPLLSEEDTTALREALGKPPPDGGLWTGPKVAAWMSRRLGRKVWPQRGWDYLKKLEHSLQMPRPKHAKAASAEDQDAFKKAWRSRSMSTVPRTRAGLSRSGLSTSTGSG
jgi:transposase